MESDLEVPTKTEWRCFHCGFTTTDRIEAEAHFTDDPSWKPVCWSDRDPDDAAKEIQDLRVQLEHAREEVVRLQNRERRHLRWLEQAVAQRDALRAHPSDSEVSHE